MPWPRFALRESRCSCRHRRLPRRFSFRYIKICATSGGPSLTRNRTSSPQSDSRRFAWSRARRDASFLMNQLCPLLNELGHDADCNFRHAARTDSDSHWTDHAPQLFLGCEVFVAEVLEDHAGLARAANHAEKQEG